MENILTDCKYGKCLRFVAQSCFIWLPNRHNAIDMPYHYSCG